MGFFRSSKNEGEGPNRERAASLNRFGFRRHKAPDEGGGGSSLARRESPRTATDVSTADHRTTSGERSSRASESRSNAEIIGRGLRSGTVESQSVEELLQLPGAQTERLTRRSQEEIESETQEIGKVEGENVEDASKARRRVVVRPTVRLCSQAVTSLSKNGEIDQDLMDRRWRTKSTPLTSVTGDSPMGPSENNTLVKPTPRGSGIIKVSNEVVTVRPSAVKQAEQKRPNSNRRVSIVTDKKDSEFSSREQDSPRYVPKKGGMIKTTVMMKAPLDNSSSSKEQNPTAAKVAKQVRQWPPTQSRNSERDVRPPSPATAPPSMFRDPFDDDLDAASPAGSEGSTVASPVSADFETRKELSHSAAKLGFVRRATMRLGEKEYTSVRGDHVESGKALDRPKTSRAANTNRMPSPLAACPGFGDEGSANELLKALAFRREKTFKLEQSWGSKGGFGDDISSDVEDSEDEVEPKPNAA